MVLTQSGSRGQGTALESSSYSKTFIHEKVFFEGDLKIDEFEHDLGNIRISFIFYTLNGESYTAGCDIGNNGDLASIWCHDWWNDGGLSTKVMEAGKVQYGSWQNWRDNFGRYKGL